MFLDRRDAGQRLAAALTRFQDRRPCVLALPRGGVPVAFEVAAALKAPLDLIIVRKIGAPGQPELAIGAVVDGQHPELVVNHGLADLLHITDAYIVEQSRKEAREIERRRRAYLGGRARLDISGRTTLVVDDGIATGASIRAALLATRRAGPARLVLAVPVAPADVVAALRSEVDEIVCLETHDEFGAISIYYGDFAQVTDEEVEDLMSRAAKLSPTEPIGPATPS
jgi:putative phosphoribosyl transferase